MLIKAPAKLNLHLQVIKKREDGFHNLRTVYQLINLYDEIEFKPNNSEIELKERPKKIKDNLVLKAAYAIKDKTNIVTITPIFEFTSLGHHTRN
mgnify:CR=1 FL=1